MGRLGPNLEVIDSINGISLHYMTHVTAGQRINIGPIGEIYVTTCTSNMSCLFVGTETIRIKECELHIIF